MRSREYLQGATVQGDQFAAKEQAKSRSALAIGAYVTGDTHLGMHDFIYLFLRDMFAVVVDVEAVRCLRPHLDNAAFWGELNGIAEDIAQYRT